MIGAEMKNKEGKRIEVMCVCVCVCVYVCVCWQKAYSFGN